MQPKKILEIIFILLLLSLSLFILTPRHWEPSVESWNKWAAARILKETGEFPSYTMGPLYVTYLIPFSLIKFPLSIMVEYWITHLFVYIAIYLLLKNYMRKSYALLLTIAWIPHLATIEPSGALWGVGFVCLYFIPTKNSWRNQGYLPPTLLSAALCHTVYLLFLIGHIIGTYIEKRQVPNSPAPNSLTKSFQYKAVMAFQLILLLLPLLMIITPVTRPDHNHMLINPTYAPIPLNSPLDMAFFQLGTERYVRRTFPESEWVYQDWYLAAPKAYNGATTTIQAILKSPKTVFRNLITNLGSGLQVPGFLVSGAYLGPISLLFFLFPLFGFIGLIEKLKQDQNYSHLLSILIGTASALGVLTLTTFNHSRYLVTLLPIAFLMLIYTPSGFSIVTQYWIKKRMRNTEKINTGKKSTEQNHNFNFKMIGIGLLSILLGIFATPHLINNIILPQKELPSFILRQIFLIDILLIMIGIIVIIFNKKIKIHLKKTNTKIKDKQEHILTKTQKISQRGIPFVVLLSTLLLISTIQYPSGTVNQFKAISQNQAFLSGQEPMSMVDAYPQLTKYLQENSKVLARENTWIMAFTNVKLENIYQIWGLPPFIDPSGETEKKLSRLDIILVSSQLESDKPSLGTESYPRYIYHIKPFLENKSKSKEWTSDTIENYGEIYQKKRPQNPESS